MRALLLVFLSAAAPALAAEPASTAATAINALGVDLLHQAGRPEGNFLISPISIESALAMTYVGADGVTRDEMTKALHLPKDYAEWSRSYVALQASLDDTTSPSAESAASPVVLTVANRLFGQAGYDMRAPFLSMLKDFYRAPFGAMDFRTDAAGAARDINDWVASKTGGHIRDLIPGGALNDQTRLVLINAIYFKAPWAQEYSAGATQLRPFHVAGGAAVNVPTMTGKHFLGYAKLDGFTVVAIPYLGGDLQFLILLPDTVNGLRALEAKLLPSLLADFARLPDGAEVILFLPKFTLEPPPLPLARELQSLGMKSAFNQPIGSANFERMAPRRGNDYLYLTQVFHKTFLKLDEHGTEAAAATGAAMRTSGMRRENPIPIQVKVDHPFLFAIQHRWSGACLFLGWVNDPR